MKDRSPSKRPFRDTAIIYAAFAVVFVLVSWATGAALLPKFDRDGKPIAPGALPVALGLFLLCTGYAWWRFRQRLESEQGGS